METKYKKASEFSENFFLFTVEKKKKKNWGWKQLNTLPLQSWSYT